MTESWPDADLERVTKCPLCGARDREFLYDGLTDRVFRVAPGTWSLYRCSTCGCGYLDPRPTRDSIGRAYSDYYTHNESDHPIVRRIGRTRSLLHDLINGYQNRRYGTAKRPATSAWGNMLFTIPSLRAAADCECRYLSKPTSNSRRRLLDVGCGNGGFLCLARQAGWVVEGVDADDLAVQTARSRGLNVHHGTVDDLNADVSAYDAITLSHVIEHVHDPTAMLGKVYALLRPGGTLWLETPNLESSGSRRFGRDWRDLDPPRHLVLFTPRSLRKALCDTGFRKVRQHWRGMSVFEVFAASQALSLGKNVSGASYEGSPPALATAMEFYEMCRPSRREFLTFTAIK